MSRKTHIKKTSPTKVDDGGILDLLRQPDYAPMTAKEISDAISLRGKGRKRIGHVLHQMVLDGSIVIIRSNRYSLGEPADLVTGRIEVRRSGDGHLIDESGMPRAYVPKENFGTALPGDRVTVRIDRTLKVAPGKLENGKIIRVLERGKRLIVGTLKSTGRFFYVLPLDPAYDQDFYIADPGEAQVGDRVVIQFAAWENRHVNPEAEIVDVIGPAENPSLDTLATIRQFGFEETFPIEVTREAESAVSEMDRPGNRLDLRKSFILTIDPETAKDFDDALSLERDATGHRVVGVHIADVAHFVRLGTALDKEAYKRGNTVYLPDKVLPMLPEQLSNGICSLKPDQDRLAFSVFITFDGEGRPIAQRFAKSIIRSKKRFTYEQVMALLSAPEPALDDEALGLLRELNRLAQQLRSQRFGLDALDLDMPECEVVMGKDGMIKEIRTVVNDISHQLVEEFMIAANEAVDTHLSRLQCALLHRVHEPPAPEKIAELAAELQELGYHPGDLRQRRHLAAFLRTIRTDPLAYHVQTSVLRSMKRAVYSPEPRGHFGLSKKYYAHFTSPIRRYPDLVVHRILAAALVSERNPYAARDLDQAAMHCSLTEQAADDAERFLVEIKKFRFLEQQLAQKRPEVYEAVVVNVRNFGLFVELIQLEIQGLVHVSAISDRFVHFDPGRETLKAGDEVFAVGSKLKVFVTRVDFDKRRLDFALSKGPQAKSGGSPGERRRGDRHAVDRSRNSRQSTRTS